ncbi:hypothetical protein MMC13_001124 [Lambiella insularis]|nr:hypothetical protein [Lambiella insularis]
MRPRFYFLILLFLALFFFISRLVSFIQLFFEHSGIALTQQEIAEAHAGTTPDPRPQVIPKIIHQVYHNWHNQSSMPEDWQTLRQTCIKLNEDWEYKLWTDESSREFIATYYPWFLSTYDGYPYPVQRCDTVRYFLLLKYGGIYLDLDNGCLENLEPLLYYPTWTTDGGRGALSNNILGSIPNHPFWELLTNSLIPYNYNYIFPYVTISYASGQWFETAIWQAYHATPRASFHENKGVRIMMDDRPGTDPWIYFTQERGGTWVNWDNRMFLWIGDHLLLLGIGLCSLVGISWWMGTRAVRSWRKRKGNEKGYESLAGGKFKQEDDDV